MPRGCRQEGSSIALSKTIAHYPILLIKVGDWLTRYWGDFPCGRCQSEAAPCTKALYPWNNKKCTCIWCIFVFHERYKGIRNSPPQCRVCPTPVEPPPAGASLLSARSASQSYRLYYDALTALLIKIAILMIAGINPHFYDIFTRTMFFTLWNKTVHNSKSP